MGFAEIRAKFAMVPSELLGNALQAVGIGAAVGVVAYLLLETVPAYVKNYEFELAAQKEARLVVTNPKPATAIQGELFEKAQEIGVPVDIQQIRVDSGVVVTSAATMDDVMSETGGDPKVDLGTVKIEVAYAVPVKFPGYTFELRFHFRADDKTA